MIHTYSYQNNQLKPLQLILLAVALLSNLVGLFMIPSAIIDPKFWFIIVGMYLFWLIIRIGTIYLTYSIGYSYYQERLLITKTYYRKKYVYADIKKSEICKITENENKDENVEKIYSKSCIYKSYIVELQNGKKYQLNLDNTLYAALTCEEEYDLFR